MKEIKIHLRESTIGDIQKILHATNLSNEFKQKQTLNNEMEEFIKGAVVREIERVNYFHTLKRDAYDSNKRLINKFEHLRKKYGYTQTYLSNVTGINQVSLSKVLNNKNQVRSDTFFKLWVAFGCPPIQKCIEFIDE